MILPIIHRKRWSFFRNRPRSVTHIIYAYGSRAPVARSPNPVSKVKMDHIFDVLFTLRGAQSGSRSSHFGCKYHICTFSRLTPLHPGNRRSLTRSLQNWSQMPRDSNKTASLIQNVPARPIFPLSLRGCRQSTVKNFDPSVKKCSTTQ